MEEFLGFSPAGPDGQLQSETDLRFERERTAAARRHYRLVIVRSGFSESESRFEGEGESQSEPKSGTGGQFESCPEGQSEFEPAGLTGEPGLAPQAPQSEVGGQFGV